MTHKTNSRKRARAKRARTFNLNFKVDDTTKALLDDLQDRTRAPSVTQVFRNALRLLERYQNAVEGGGHLVIVDSKGKSSRVEFL